MSCRSCGFENMKNSRVCARCGAKLVWDGAIRKKDFLPGRRKGGRVRRFAAVPVYRLGRIASRLVGFLSPFLAGLFSPFGVFRRIPGENARRGCASVVPGIGLALAGETRRAIGVFAGWALAIAATAVFVWLELRHAALGMGIAAYLHARAVVAAVRPEECSRGNGEARLLALFLTVGVFAVYAFAAYWIFRDMTFARSPFTRTNRNLLWEALWDGWR